MLDAAATAAALIACPRLWSEENGEAFAVPELLQNMLQDILNEDTFHAAVAETEDLPIPYFQQFRQRSDAVAPGPRSQATSRPASRANNEAFMHANKGAFPGPSTTANAFLTSAAEDADQPTPAAAASSMRNIDLFDDSDILFSAEFQRLTEDILDMSLSNILSEAEANEFSITSRSRVVAHTIRPRT